MYSAQESFKQVSVFNSSTFFINTEDILLLPMILVPSQIKYMLGGEIGKITREEQSKRNLLVYNILVHCEGVDFKVTGIKFIRRSDAACF